MLADVQRQFVLIHPAGEGILGKFSLKLLPASVVIGEIRGYKDRLDCGG